MIGVLEHARYFRRGRADADTFWALPELCHSSRTIVNEPDENGINRKVGIRHTPRRLQDTRDAGKGVESKLATLRGWLSTDGMTGHPHTKSLGGASMKKFLILSMWWA